MAILTGHKEIAKYLLEHGAVPNLYDTHHRLPIDLITDQENFDEIKEMLMTAMNNVGKNIKNAEFKTKNNKIIK